jgi:hypothetical protein
MRAFAPADEIETMLTVQAMAQHHAAMECARRAMLADQPFEIAQQLHKTATNASRVFIELLAALDRRRKGGQQVVRVEHIHIHSGANAVVGNIAAPAIGGGGDVGKNQGEPRTSPSRLAHDTSLGAVLPPLRSENPEREVVPVARDEELPVPDARRKQHRANGGRN